MASTPVAVCNLALSELADKPIADLTDATERARLCNQFYKDAVKHVLRQHDWRCATKRAQLSRLEKAPAFEFAYAYELPPDWVRTIKTSLDVDGLRWTQEGNAILTDESAVLIKYVYLNENVASWDAMLTTTVAAYLAHLIAGGLTEGVSKKKLMHDLYMLRLKEAKATDSQEGTADDLTCDVLIVCRN